MKRDQLPWWLSWLRICLQCWRPRVDSWVRKYPWRRVRLPTPAFLGFPCGSGGKESACSVGDQGLIPGSGRYPGEGTGNPLQYSCLENAMDRGAWWTIVHGVTRVRHNLTTKLPMHKSSQITDRFQFSSVAQSCPTLCDPMNPSTPGLPVHHQLPQFTQTHVHQVSDASQPSHPWSSPSPPAPNPS